MTRRLVSPSKSAVTISADVFMELHHNYTCAFIIRGVKLFFPVILLTAICLLWHKDLFVRQTYQLIWGAPFYWMFYSINTAVCAAVFALRGQSASPNPPSPCPFTSLHQRPRRLNNLSWKYSLHLLTRRHISNIVWGADDLHGKDLFPASPSPQNNSWKSLCDGNKGRLASSRRRGDQGGRKTWNDSSQLGRLHSI